MSLARGDRSTYGCSGRAHQGRAFAAAEQGRHGRDVDIFAAAWNAHRVTDSRKHLAGRRLEELIAEASDRISRISAVDGSRSVDAFHAGWATYRALGFLEAYTIFDSESTDALMSAFEPLMQAIGTVSRHGQDPAG